MFLLAACCGVAAQCHGAYDQNQSPKIANYDITVDLNHDTKIATCSQVIRWKNTSPDTLSSLRFYMYMNAFKDMQSSYLMDSEGKMFGRNIADRSAKEWGHITIDQMTDGRGSDLTTEMRFIQENDGNAADQSILEVALAEPILPGTEVTYHMAFTTKMPKTIARAGYSQKDWFLFVHWFPQVCVYEQDKDNIWGWNSHQFLPMTEFFADFGDYDVTIHAADHLTIGASGCRISQSQDAGRQTVRFKAHDLIDFGFVVYSDFEKYEYTHLGVDIEILMPPEHCAFADRYLEAIEHSMTYLHEHVGPYPYPKITVIDPPVHALNSGFMEYPMMITAASFYGIPRGIRSVESLVIHEFTHMYFMATLASNEKEEAWLDEGFVTYYEDRITDHYHGDRTSLFNILGFTSGNAENSRLEYTRLRHEELGQIARPGWDIKGPYKGLIYAKTSSMLKTLEGLVSRPVMDQIIQNYFEAYKFKHPKEKDFRRIVRESLADTQLNFDLDLFFDQCLHGTGTSDFELVDLTNTPGSNGYRSLITVKQNGTLIFPVDISLTDADSHTTTLRWDGSGGEKTFTLSGEHAIVSADIDPNRKIFLDLDFNNNSLTYDPHNPPKVKYAGKVGYWVQTLIHAASTFF